MNTGAYCRAVESHLCRKNDGHLIRIVGPAFELVCGWEEAGIPISVVERAIDRRYARYYASGPKRRPVRIEYCEPDVLDTFDEWRRAVGIGAAQPNDGESPTPVDAASSSRRRSLAAHLDEVASRLAAWPDRKDAAVAHAGSRVLAERVAQMASLVDAARSRATGLRGDARARVIEQLESLDGELLAGARAAADQGLMRDLRAEAAASLEPFRPRMAAPAFQEAVEAATDRLLVEHFRLPPLSYG